MSLQQESQQLAMLPMDEKYDRKETREGEGEKYSSVPEAGRGDLVKTGWSSCIPTWPPSLSNWSHSRHPGLQATFNFGQVFSFPTQQSSLPLIVNNPFTVL